LSKEIFFPAVMDRDIFVLKNEETTSLRLSRVSGPRSDHKNDSI
jgi:hypothetical protein